MLESLDIPLTVYETQWLDTMWKFATLYNFVAKQDMQLILWQKVDIHVLFHPNKYVCFLFLNTKGVLTL